MAQGAGKRNTGISSCADPRYETFQSLKSEGIVSKNWYSNMTIYETHALFVSYSPCFPFSSSPFFLFSLFLFFSFLFSFFLFSFGVFLIG